MQKNAMKVTNRPNANGHFIKLAKEYGIRLESAYIVRKGVKYQQDKGFLTKKWGCYGRDEKGLFYCDEFHTNPNYKGKKPPKLRVWRLVDMAFDYATATGGKEWVCGYEQNTTTARIIYTWKNMGCPTPLAYKNLDCKKNNAIAHKIVYGKRNAQKTTMWGADEFCDWQKENASMVTYCKKK